VKFKSEEKEWFQIGLGDKPTHHSDDGGSKHL
jgi:hypothetical protein